MPPVDYRPETATEHRARWHRAVLREWDFTDVRGELPPETDRPGLYPEHVFDDHYGLRLIVSTDRYPFGVFLHVSASVWPDSKLGKTLPRPPAGIGEYPRAIEDPARTEYVRRLEDRVRERVLFLGGGTVTLGYVTMPRTVAHFFNPPLGCLKDRNYNFGAFGD